MKSQNLSARLVPVGDDDRPDNAAVRCGNCAAVLRGRYCHECGSREIDAEDFSTRHFVAKAAGEITDVQHSKLLGTLRALLLRPGFLTHEYFSARRVRYLRPLALCLGIFALHFFVYGVGGKVSLFDSERQARVEASQFNVKPELLLQRRVVAAASASGTTPEQIYRSIDERWAANATLLQIPVIVLFALVLRLAHPRSRRRFVEHLIFSMHFISFQMLTVVLLWPLYGLLGDQVSGPVLIMAALKYLIDTVYLYLAIRNYYGGPVRKTLIRAPLVFGGYFLVYVLAQASAMMLAQKAVL